MRMKTTVLFVMLALAGCETGLPPDPAGPVTETIGPAGGSIEASDATGNVLRLDFPAGALYQAIDVTLRPLGAAGAAWARFEIQPAGQRLARPVEITLEAGAGAPVDGASNIAFGPLDDPSSMPTRFDAANSSLTASATILGGYPELSANGLTPQQDNLLDPITVRQIDCLIEMNSLLVRLEFARQFTISSAASAKQLLDQILVVKGQCGEEPDYDPIIRRIQERTCEALRDAEADATVVLIDNRDRLLEYAGAIAKGAAIVQAAGGDCEDTWRTTMDDQFDEFIGAYGDRVSGPGFTTNYSDIWNELRLGGFTLLGDTQMLGMGEAEAKVRTAVLGPMLDRLREAGYRACREEHTQQFLVDLLTSGKLLNHRVPIPIREGGNRAFAPQAEVDLMPFASFGKGDLETDIQVCGSSATVEVWGPVEHFSSFDRTVAGNGVPGGHTREALTSSPIEGSLEIRGEIRALFCVNEQSSFDTADLVLELNGVEVDRLQHSNGDFLSSVVSLDLDSTLAKAGIDPENPPTSPVALAFIREGAACDGDYGPADFTLFTVDIAFDPKPSFSSAPSASPNTVDATEDASGATSVTFTLPFEDAGANIRSLTAVFELVGGARIGPLRFDIGSPKLSGLSGASGEGSYTDEVSVFCSEAGKNPMNVILTLTDAFNQTSAEKMIAPAITVDYGVC